MHCPGFDPESYAFYTLGTLEATEAAKIDEHLGMACETCSAAVSKATEVWHAVGLSTPDAKPSFGLRRKVLAPFSVTKPWWLRPLPALSAVAAAALLLVAGWQIGRPSRPAPTIALTPSASAPVSIPAPAPSVPPAANDSPRVTVVTNTVIDPAQTQAIESLNLDLTRERERVKQLETDLSQRQTQLATAQEAARSAEQRYRTAADQIAGSQNLVRTVNDLRARATELERQVVQYRALLETERNRVDRSTQLVAMMSDPSVRLVRLRTTEKGQNMQGHALIAGDSQLVFFGSQLPPLPAGRTYQLWVLRSKGPAIVSAGTFNPTGSRQAMLQFGERALLSNITALAITDEPAGGSVLPTGHKWMIGS